MKGLKEHAFFNGFDWNSLSKQSSPFKPMHEIVKKVEFKKPEAG